VRAPPAPARQPASARCRAHGRPPGGHPAALPPCPDPRRALTVRPTSLAVLSRPADPFVGPVVQTTRVRPTPLNPFIGPVVSTNTFPIGH
jgi:hypothetical protein